MPIVFGTMLPHPPIILPEIGKGEEKKVQATVNAYRKAAEELVSYKPDTIIVASPHSAGYTDFFHISAGKSAQGDMSRFGVPKLEIRVEYDTQLVNLISQTAEEIGFPAGVTGEVDASLDHGTFVPLYFIEKAYGGNIPAKVVRVGLSGLSFQQHYRLGQLIAEAGEKLDRKIAFVASGDLSHKLKADGPYGFAKEGPEYDKTIMDVMGSGDFGKLFTFSEELVDAAAMCGQGSFAMMAGTFDGVSVESEKLSYEDNFGVGYGICTYIPTGHDESRRFLDVEKVKNTLEESPPVMLARKTVEGYIQYDDLISIPQGVPEEYRNTQAGVFVTLKKGGMLRGCIGTITPTTQNISEEIIQNAISSATRDPRFPPVTQDELPELEYSVDILGDAEDISSIDELDIKRYGVIVTSGLKKGLLLPNLDGVESVDEQVEIARDKAGISPEEKISLKRFEVVRYY